ncbi:tRNA (guanine-N(1)-)-methyltransferase [Phycisphaerae bacterium RAS1]|nr:tRNA (guanine-N(1)-)-methyltransferase [Phycisphaerae bacterium RAS1]
MRIDVLTLFPEVMSPYLAASILGRAQAAAFAEIHLHQLRDYSTDPHKKVDDRPFGGGPGMVLMCQPVVDAVAAIEKLDQRPALRIMLTPQGRPFTQQTARRFSAAPRLLLICGHYEGFDERIVALLQPEEISLGDFVLTGGEIAALAMIDSVVRLLPGVLGNDETLSAESFDNGLLDCPHYTRPRAFRGLEAPAVLLSGNHAEIAAWRSQQARARTAERRPDLLEAAPLTDQPLGDRPLAGLANAGSGRPPCRPSMAEDRSHDVRPARGPAATDLSPAVRTSSCPALHPMVSSC